MPTDLEIVLQAYLHPTEVIKVALAARVSFSQDLDTQGVSVPQGGSTARVLAVVSHRDSPESMEEGCLFIFKTLHDHREMVETSSMAREYVLDRILQISGKFSITMAQARRNTLDLRSSAASFALAQPRAEIELTVSSGQNSTPEPVLLLTSDTQVLKVVIAECKRLKDLSDTEHIAREAGIYPWLAPYIARASVPSILSPIPPDLRTLQEAVHGLLSPATAGDPGDEAFDVSVIRADWMRQKVKEELLAKHDRSSTLRLRIGTFNVNGKLPSQDLSVWVRDRPEVPPLLGSLKKMAPLSLISDDDSSTLDSVSKDREDDIHDGREDPDILVLAFQELDLSTEALLYSTSTTREDAWCAAIFAGLGEKAVYYEKLASKQLVGMLLVIVVKKDVKECFADTKAASTGAGIMGIMGNKGASALRLTYMPRHSSGDESPRPTVLTFVNSHLAAFEEMYERRNADFQDISKRLAFTYEVEALSPSGQGKPGDPLTLHINVFETDALFWMGGQSSTISYTESTAESKLDLNYRINLPDSDVRSLLSSTSEEETRLLLKYDQLLLAIRARSAFEGFSEHPITHSPSYRFSAGVASDQQGYDVKRKPAWTDRVLHMHSALVPVRQLTYTSHPEIFMSDHKPISATFHLHTPALSATTYNAFIRGLWRDVASIEHHDSTPRLKLSGVAVDLGQIYYKRTATRTIELENTGMVACAFRFMRAGHQGSIYPDWFTVDTMAGLLLPGQRTSLSVSSYVDATSASRLNRGPTLLEYTLILHVAFGKDYFISVTGEYERTCFANSLSWLSRLPGPIRKLTSVELLPEDRGATAPTELMRLIKGIMNCAANIDELFLQDSDPATVESIRECLDTGDEFPIPQAHQPALAWAFTDTLLQLLESLPDPIIPFALHPRCAQVSSKEEAFELLDELPSVSVNVWISITAVLHYIAQQAAAQSTIERLVAKFTTVLLPDKDGSTLPMSIIGRRRFLRFFIS